MRTIVCEYIPKADTCKRRWCFTVVDGRFDRIEIEGEEGCKGHPQTMSVLLKGMRVDAVDVEALAGQVCDRDVSCGQALAEAIRSLREDIEAAEH